jgi:lipopolysaccharide transport system ATP-binding protein
MPIIDVNHLTKEYQLGYISSLKDTTLNTLRRMTFRPIHERERFKALDDVTFNIEAGEVVGIIGHNGAGKSTLLKLLANISKPTKGKVVVRGSIAPLIEVGAGVNPELTGRENIFLNAAILGIPKKIVKQKLDDIIEFSELEQFIDTPVKRYSSGMTVKLGFSIATSMDADILIIDEVLAVGDLAFQRKCFDRMEDIIKHQSKTVLLVSHNIRQIERICKRVLLLDHGKITADGASNLICSQFYSENDEKIKQQAAKNNVNIHKQDYDIIELINIEICGNDNIPTDKIKYLDNIYIRVFFKNKIRLVSPRFGIGIHTTDFLYITTEHTFDQFKNKTVEPGTYCIEMKVDRFPLLPRPYSIRFGIGTGELVTPLFYAESLAHFQVYEPIINETMREGFISLNPSSWNLHSIRNTI